MKPPYDATESPSFSAEAYRTFLELLFSLLAEKIETPTIQSADLQEKLQNPSDETFPFFAFKKAFSLSTFQMHCVLLGLLPYHPKNLVLQKNLNEAYKTPIATTSVAISLYDSIAIDTFSVVADEMTPLFQSFFLQNDDVTPLDFVLILNQELAEYLLMSAPKKMCSAYLSLKKYVPQTVTIPPLSLTHHTKTMVQIEGKKSSGRLHIAEQLLATEEKNILLVAAHIYHANHTQAKTNGLYEISHQCFLQNAIPCIYGMEEILKLSNEETHLFCMEFFHFFQANFPYFFVITEPHTHFAEFIPQSIVVLHYESAPLSYDAQVSIWQEKTQDFTLEETVDFHSIVNRFQFSKNEIRERIEEAHNFMRLANEVVLTQAHLERACNGFSTHLQEIGSELVQSHYTWDDLILAPSQKQLLQHACNYMKLQHIVYESWDFKKLHTYGKNLSILLEGVPGTGKTMAAEVIANDLNMALFKLDIPKVTSRYIGEAEKKMNEIFNEAEKCNAIVFIDEMESFFGKRTEIKDAHEKYANMQTSFLLQKIEDFRGVLLLATNHLEYIDEAFIRRIKFIVSMALPKEKERLKLWQTMFPKTAPLAADIDFQFLAKNFEISGGVIKNIVIKSAFSAYGDNSEITMQHILHALKYELSKQGIVLVASDFAEYDYLVGTD
ncbi:MAG: ATP-binding protein [Bacillota bacterium]